MILNMPVSNGAINSPASPGENEYTNFLKRKYSEHHQQQQQLEQHPLTVNSNSCNTDFDSNASQITNNNWKKRHIEPQTGESNYVNSLTNFNHNDSDYKTSESQINTNNNNSESQEHNSGTFNIIANSSFINDLFEYDANLIVPVSVNNLTDTVLTDQTSFTTPSTVCVSSNVEYEDENGEQWQASDLLELDHRYNSSLQTEISQLNPTVNLKSHTFPSSLNENGNSASNLQTQEQTQFLVPSKPFNQPSSNISTPKRLNTNLSSSLPTTSSTSSSSSSSSSSTSFVNDSLEQDCDFEDKNLSWLLNFKFDEFPHLNPDVANMNSNVKSVKSSNNSNYNINNNSTTYCSSNSTSISTGKSTQNSLNGSLMSERSKSPKSGNKTGKKFEELVMEVTSELDGNDMIVAENVVIEESSHRAPKKPPFTYTELIEYALEDKGELTVSGIYQWISDRFPYYKSNDDRWKNSVRHNLSINPHFRKGHKAPQGAGHLWTISSGDSAENVLAWEHKKQRLDLFFKMESMNRERLQQHQQKQQQERLLQNGGGGGGSGSGGQQKQHIGCQQEQCLYDEAAVAAAAIQQEMLQPAQNNNDGSIQNQNSISGMESTSNSNVLHELPFNDLLTDEELRKTAGQILNGIHREVEVQSVNQTIIGTYQDVLLDNEYLNPIHKDVVVNESGLRHNSTSNISSHCHSNHSSTGPYYVTEIDPMELGIQISNHHQNHTHHQHIHHSSDPTSTVSEDSDVVLFNDEFNLNYFTYNPANDIVA
ncbi:forkhead domain 3F [Cochliomyia hominivorax]